MKQYEDDGLEDLGWFICMLAACGFLFVAVTYFLYWAEVL